MALIDQVKRKLNITWSDDATDNRVQELMASAEPHLKRKLGMAADADYDFATPGTENILFLAYCLYEWNHCANEFDDNYAIEIAECRAAYEVAHFVETEGEADAETS